jgi:hypothetical protein
MKLDQKPHQKPWDNFMNQKWYQRFKSKLLLLMALYIYSNIKYLKLDTFWRVSSSGIWRRVVRRVSTDVSEEHIASILRVCLPPACLLDFAQLISSILKMEAICSSETSVETQRTIWRHIAEDDTLYNHHSENLKSLIPSVYLWPLTFVKMHAKSLFSIKYRTYWNL